ncbi:hypothetical protein I4U23_023500 [Adineta vaga]|nr:hypothetical protein I4U23_023500 [Adineta vaga]
MLLYSFLVLILLHNVTSLKCNKCHYDTIFNYTITTETVPLMPANCTIVDALHTCSIEIHWMKSPIQSSVFYDSNSGIIRTSYHHVFSSVEHRANGYAKQQDTHTLMYSCDTDGCNNNTALKAILNALTLTEQLNELESLLAPGYYPTFTEQESCFNSFNTTQTSEQCKSGSASIPTCIGCRIEVNSNEFCAQCAAQYYLRIDDYILRTKIFFLYNRTQTDRMELFCRTKNCNALTSIDKIRQKSSLEFDFDKFFNGLTPSSTGHTFHFLIFILFIEQFFVFLV